MKCLIVYNPRSGKLTDEPRVEIITQKMREKYEIVDTLETTVDRTESIEKVRAVYAEYDAIIVSGGDGTLNMVAESMANRDDRRPIGYIPHGTVNDFAHIKDIPLDTEGACDKALTGTPTPQNAMMVNGRLVTYFLGTGVFTTSSYVTPQTDKNRIGKFAYYKWVIKQDTGRKGVCDMTYSTDKGISDFGKFSFAIFVNGNRVGGIKLNKKKEFNSIECVLIKRAGKGGTAALLRNILDMVPAFLKGIHKCKNTKRYRYVQAEKVTIHCPDPNCVWNMDGERGFVGDITVEYNKGCFDLIC